MQRELGIERILVPVDLGPNSEVVFAHALKLALATGANLTAVHIADDPDEAVDWTAMAGPLELLVRWGVLPEGATEQDVVGLGLHVERDARVYESTQLGLVTALIRKLPNIIVAGTHGRTGLERLRHGSVAEAVARRSGAVTLFVPDGTEGILDPDTGRAKIDRVLFPVGGEESELQHAFDVLGAFLDVIEAGDVEVVVVHVEDGPVQMIEPEPDEHRTYVVDLRSGDVVAGIAEAIDDREPDLVVMATHGHDGLMDMLRGSKTEQVLRRASCPVLAVPLG